jgi:hypothetical protein
MARRLRVEAAQPDRVHLELGGQQITDLAGLLVASLGEVLHRLFPFAWPRPATRAPSPFKVTVSANSAATVLRALAKINEGGAQYWFLRSPKGLLQTHGQAGVTRLRDVGILAVKRSKGLLGRSLGLPDPVMGYVIECLVEAYLLVSGGGRLTTARPNTDVDHKDFIVDMRGHYRSLYIQVKGSPRVFGRQIFQAGVDFREGKVMSDPRLVYVFCLLDAKAMRLARVWVIPASDFSRLAPRERIRRGYVRLAFNAGQSGKWARFEIEPTALGPRILELIAKQGKRPAIAKRRLSRAA